MDQLWSVPESLQGDGENMLGEAAEDDDLNDDDNEDEDDLAFGANYRTIRFGMEDVEPTGESDHDNGSDSDADAELGGDAQEALEGDNGGSDKVLAEEGLFDLMDADGTDSAEESGGDSDEELRDQTAEVHQPAAWNEYTEEWQPVMKSSDIVLRYLKEQATEAAKGKATAPLITQKGVQDALVKRLCEELKTERKKLETQIPQLEKEEIEDRMWEHLEGKWREQPDNKLLTLNSEFWRAGASRRFSFLCPL